jgi:hypothetical protein
LGKLYGESLGTRSSKARTELGVNEIRLALELIIDASHRSNENKISYGHWD